MVSQRLEKEPTSTQRAAGAGRGRERLTLQLFPRARYLGAASVRALYRAPPPSQSTVHHDRVPRVSGLVGSSKQRGRTKNRVARCALAGTSHALAYCGLCVGRPRRGRGRRFDITILCARGS